MAKNNNGIPNGVGDISLVMEFKDTAGNLAQITIKHPKIGLYLEPTIEIMQGIVDNQIILSAKGYLLDSPANVYYFAKEKEYIVSPQQALKDQMAKLTKKP